MCEKGKEAHIAAKMNSLCDLRSLQRYASSLAIVRIDLLIRGISAAEGGAFRVSAKISTCVRSSVISEHQPYFLFPQWQDSDEIYMEVRTGCHNLDRRVEIVFPVEDERIKEEIMHVLDLEFCDNVSISCSPPVCEAQDKRGKTLIIPRWNSEAKERARQQKEKKKRRVFIG